MLHHMKNLVSVMNIGGSCEPVTDSTILMLKRSLLFIFSFILTLI
jgi:hypothetical protein